eukprot:gene3712-6601_t
MLKPELSREIILLGDCGVGGKTSFLAQYISGTFTPDTISTVGLDCRIKKISTEKKDFRYKIWDSAGQERFESILVQFWRTAIPDCDCAIISYDITDIRSFKNVTTRWVPLFNKFNKTSDSFIILVGNKIDLFEQRVVDPKEELEIAEKIGALAHFGVSSKTGENVSNVFEFITEEFIKRTYSKVSDTLFDSNFKFLKKIDFSCERLTSFPLEIMECKLIEELDLSGNKIINVPFELKKQQSLKIIDLSNNQISEFPTFLVSLINLEILDLSKNQFSKDLMKKYNSLSELKEKCVSIIQEFNKHDFCETVVGQGGEGFVTKAISKKNENEVFALKHSEMKHYHAQLELITQFFGDMIGLDHPNILKHLSIQKYMKEKEYFGNVLHFVIKMEYCNGGDLENFIKNCKRPMKDETILDWMIQITNGLEYLHSLGIIHRDIKTRNILIFNQKDESSKQLKLCDFGFSAQSKFQTIVSNNHNGTLTYLPPESYDKKLYKFESDIWCLGIVLFQLIFNYPEISLQVVYLRNAIVENNQKGINYLKNYFIDENKKRSFDLNPKLCFICAQCLKLDPYLRPNTKKLIELLKMNENDKLFQNSKSCIIQ